jgi:hypothetical protein
MRKSAGFAPLRPTAPSVSGAVAVTAWRNVTVAGAVSTPVALARKSTRLGRAFGTSAM